MSTFGDYAGKENHTSRGASKIICLHPKGNMNILSIVIVGVDSECKKLEQCMQQVNDLENLNYKFTTTCLTSLDNVPERESGPVSIHADYIVFLVDVTNPTCLDQIRESIFYLDSIFLCGRIALINFNHKLPIVHWSIDSDAIPSLCQEFNLNLINGDLTNEKTANHTAKRTLILVTTVCGLKTGFPCTIDFPYHVFDQPI
uniref:Centromere protein M n=1 Tax=Cacopsylla melanoneura TaxID=428564 RepID=A0A8D8SSA9_9HEMI